MKYLQKRFSVPAGSLSVSNDDWDRIFGKCSKHPKYKAVRPPTSDCRRCKELWVKRNH